jgi:hypothetical protein
LGGTQDFNAGPLTTGDWHFLAASYRTNGSLVVCVDGVLKSNELGQLRTVGTANAWIGALTIDEGAHFARYFRGAIDDVRIFNRALTPDELQLLYILDQGSPAIVTPDSPQVAAVGTDFELIVTPRGAHPLHFQWYKEGVALAGATNALLQFVEVEVSDAGSYKLMASNFVGVAWSPVIPLEVPPPLNSSQVLDAGPLGFVFPGKDSWQADLNEARIGTSSLATGVVADGEAASVETDLRGPGELAFWWKVSSEPGFDRLELWIGQDRLQVLSGEQEWREVVLAIPFGVHRVRWTFRRDPTGGGGQNRAWLDGLRYTPNVGVPPMLSLTQPRIRRRDGLLSAVLHSPTGIFEAQLSADAVTWEPWKAVTNQTGQVELRWSPPAGGGPRFLRVRQP